MDKKTSPIGDVVAAFGNQLHGVRYEFGALETRLDAKLQGQVEERRREGSELASKMNDVVDRSRKLELAEKAKKEQHSAEARGTGDSSWLPTAVIVGAWPFETPPEVWLKESEPLVTVLSGLEFILEPPRPPRAA